MFFSKLIHLHCFQWKLQVPSFSRLGLYRLKSLACANLRMLQKEDHARDKSSPLFCPPHHTASCHRVSSPSEKGYTAVFQGGVLSCSLSCEKLGAALGARAITDGPFTSSREKQRGYPASLWGSYNWSFSEKELWTPTNIPYLLLTPK